MRSTHQTLAAVLLAALVAAPAPAAPPGTPAARPHWRGTGGVVAILPPPSSLHATRPVIIIRHDPIRGLMDETMDMPFLAASMDLFGDLRPGDRVAFGLKDVPDALLVVGIERLGAPAAGRARGGARPPAPRRGPPPRPPPPPPAPPAGAPRPRAGPGPR